MTTMSEINTHKNTLAQVYLNFKLTNITKILEVLNAQSKLN